MQWLQEAYSICTTKNWDGELTTVSYAMIRALRSAASQFIAWDLMVLTSGAAYLDQRKWLLCQPCCPTDCLEYTIFATDMAARIGEHDKQPAQALLDRHMDVMGSQY